MASGSTTPIRAPPATSRPTSTSTPSRRTAGRGASRPATEIRAYVEGVARRFGVFDKVRTGTEVQSASWHEERGKWQLETSAGPHEADLLLTACGQLSVPKVPPIAGLGELRGPGFPHRRVAPRRRPGRQARSRDRHRLQRDPGRPGDPARSGGARRLPALPRLDLPQGRLRVLAADARPVQAPPGPAPPRPRLDPGLPGVRRGGDDQQALAAADPAGDRQAADQLGDRRSRAAPQGDAERRGRLQADHAHRRVVPGPGRAQRRAGDRADRDAHSEGHPRRERRRAPGRRDRARHRLCQSRLRRANGDRRPRGPQPRRGLGGSRSRLPRPQRAPLPQHVLALRPQHQRRHRLGGQHAGVRHWSRAGRLARDGAGRGRAHRAAA